MCRPFCSQGPFRPGNCGLTSRIAGHQAFAKHIVIVTIVRTISLCGQGGRTRTCNETRCRAVGDCGRGIGSATCQSNAASLNTMDDVGAAIQACWTPPADAGNSTVTLSFSFKRNGTLIGPPRPAAINVTGDAKARQSFVDAAIAAVEDCLPLSFSPALAQGIAGNVFTLQFSSPKQ